MSPLAKKQVLEDSDGAAKSAEEAAAAALKENEETGAEESTEEEETSTDEGNEEASEEETSDTSEESDEGSDEGDEEDLSKQPESVRELVQSIFDKKANEYGRRLQEADRSKDRSGALDELLGELSDRIKSRKEEGGELSLKNIDINDPAQVEKYVEQKVESLIEKKVGPILKKTEIREVEAEFSEFAKNHPDYHKYGKAMAELIGKYPKLSLEAVYKLASYDSQKEQGKDEAQKIIKKKKQGNLESSGAPIEDKKSKKVLNARDAVLAAMDEHGVDYGR